MNPSQTTTSGLDAFFAKIESLSKIQRILIFAGVIIAIIAIFIFVLYKPKLAEIDILDKQIKALEKKLVTAKRNAANLKKFQKQMQEAEAQFKTAMKALPERQEIPSLLTSISRSGQDVGLNFSLFAPKPDVPREFYAEIPVEIKATGGYHDLAVFFDKVARLPRIVNIKSLGMEMNKKKGVNLNPLDLQMSCKAVTYKFVEPPRKQPGMKKKK